MRRAVFRITYVLALLSMLGWIAVSVAGGYAYKAADGMVVGDTGSISPEYTVTVLDIPVRNGDLVKKGDIVARVSSSRVAEVTATLSTQSSQLITQMASISVRAGMIGQLIASARMRDRTVVENARQLEEIRARGLLPLLTENALVEQIFRGKQELAVLEAEQKTMTQQIAQVIAASRFTDQAITDIQTLFDAGRMRAPMSGYIAGIEVGIGAVVQPGSNVAEMVGEQRFVLAYFPISRLYELQNGAPVTIEVGVGKWLRGSITRVMPIAARLPKEFQKTLAPVERQQIVRIDFDQGEVPPPYFTKVVVR